MASAGEKRAGQPPRVGVIAIGRNEGERLRACLESVCSQAPVSQVVYVDSNSTDGSVDMARSLGVEVVELDLSRKFTAARARNAGLSRLLELAPEVTHVQFVDGDCEVVPDWIANALKEFSEDEELAVVCGRRRERFPDYSLYNKLCDLEWDTPIGDVAACGGDALILVEALRRVGGYRESLIAGEEPEMCFRMRGLGYKIRRIDREMTLHDAAMDRASQWFKRAKRSGHAAAEHAGLYGRDPEHLGVKPTLSNAVWGLAVPAAIGATAIASSPLVAIVGGALAYGHLYRKSYEFERTRREEADAKLYAVACVAGKIPEALGALTYFSNRVLGRQSQLMEYKAPKKA